MRLINAKTLTLEPVSGPDEKPYAILSHTWLRPSHQEVTFQDFADAVIRETKPGFNEIREACKLALEAGWEYVWIDTCCIDKSSSAELQEAINSIGARFLGTRDSLAAEISIITNIDVCYLKVEGKKNISEASVAHRMSWISRRETQKDQDMAYCMLGLFDVSLPLLYGEGWGAFRRLQEAIVAKSDDESVFAWEALSNEPRGMIASRPLEFQHSGKIQSTSFHRTRPPYGVTNRGVEFWNPARSVPGLVTRWMRQSTFNGLWGQVTRPFDLRLNCEDEEGRLVAIRLAPDPATETFYRMNSASLDRCEKEDHLNLMAVLYGGFEQIFVKAPDHPMLVQAEPLPTPTLLDRIATPFHLLGSLSSFDNLLLILVIQSFSVFFLLATTLHRTLRLEPLSKLNVFLGWAYLTLGWKVHGENFYFWFGALACGLVTSRGVDAGRRMMAGALLAPGVLGVASWGVTRLRGLGGGG
ncbi:hypothetical protein PRZ48_006925 [Zasmidium cellare]|uniref:Heterokaryon incompatibility domain-containing protein n=1 Tax=Zasmidium cellare TaxID=395010 RepID=A0ABR0EIB8_ZASCE|nr:hypothetical protein PRZ48_006925 [Zasmidium cellare]